MKKAIKIIVDILIGLAILYISKDISETYTSGWIAGICFVIVLRITDYLIDK